MSQTNLPSITMGWGGSQGNSCQILKCGTKVRANGKACAPRLPFLSNPSGHNFRPCLAHDHKSTVDPLELGKTKSTVNGSWYAVGPCPISTPRSRIAVPLSAKIKSDQQEMTFEEPVTRHSWKISWREGLLHGLTRAKHNSCTGKCQKM